MTVLHQDIGDSWCVRTSVTLEGLGAWAAGSAVADVGDAGGGSGVLDEDLAVEVGDGDLVAVGDDEDLLEAVLSADHVGDPGQAEGAGGGQLPDAGAGGQVRRCRCGAKASWRPPGRRRAGSGLGRGASAFSVASQAVGGVTRPGSPWWGRSVL